MGFKWIVIRGYDFNALDSYGPFASLREAEAWRDRKSEEFPGPHGVVWRTARLEDPKELEVLWLAQ